MSADVLLFGPMEDAPNRIRELRLEAGLSQQALGEAVGVSKMTISDLERGRMRLDLEYMRRIAKAMDIKAADLLPLADNPDALSIAERRLVEQYRSADEVRQEELARVADVITPFRHAPYEPAKRPVGRGRGRS